MNFAQILKFLRKRKKLSQDDLGNALGITKSAICKYEKAGIYPTGEGLCTLADYFGVTTDQLLGRAPLPDENIGKEVTKLEKGLTQRLEECLLAFVERVSKGEATTEAETQVLPAVAQVLVNLRNQQKKTFVPSHGEGNCSSNVACSCPY